VVRVIQITVSTRVPQSPQPDEVVDRDEDPPACRCRPPSDLLWRPRREFSRGDRDRPCRAFAGPVGEFAQDLRVARGHTLRINRGAREQRRPSVGHW